MTCLLVACVPAFAQRHAMAPPVAGQPPMMPREDQEVQQLLARLTELSKLVAQHPNSWQQQISQADVVMQLAARSQGKEREEWLRMAVDSVYAAAAQAPDGEPAAYQRLQQMAPDLARAFPESKAWVHAARMEIQAEYVRSLAKQDADPTKAQVRLRDRLTSFAGAHPDVPEAAEAVMEAAAICESLKSTADAVRCYQYVASRYAGTPVARRAAGRQWRLGGVGSEVGLSLPYLYPSSAQTEPPFDLKELRGKVVVVYFWACSAEAGGDLQTLKWLTDRYSGRGLEVVYVNLDADAAKARAFLEGKLLSGTHLHQKGGLDSETGGRFGLKALPEALLIGGDGKLIAHSLSAAQLEGAVSEQLPGKR
jgi:TolA-binding protein